MHNEEEIYFNFFNSIKSEITKRIYERDLKFYLNFCNLNKMSEFLEIKDPQRQIIDYIMSLRKKGLASNSISTMLMGIYHFYETNDMPLNKKKINMFKGEFSRKVIDWANHDKINYEYRMDVVPINFNEHGKELLGRFQHIVSKGWFSISNIEHKDLITQMRTARYKENGNLDKAETSDSTFDTFDSARLALKMFPLAKKVR
jgi:hypothetical protein